jgi:hypothetical protein
MRRSQSSKHEQPQPFASSSQLSQADDQHVPSPPTTVAARHRSSAAQSPDVEHVFLRHPFASWSDHGLPHSSASQVDSKEHVVPSRSGGVGQCERGSSAAPPAPAPPTVPPVPARPDPEAPPDGLRPPTPPCAADDEPPVTARPPLPPPPVVPPAPPAPPEGTTRLFPPQLVARKTAAAQVSARTNPFTNATALS